jgi:hypothetical protein
MITNSMTMNHLFGDVIPSNGDLPFSWWCHSQPITCRKDLPLLVSYYYYQNYYFGFQYVTCTGVYFVADLCLLLLLLLALVSAVSSERVGAVIAIAIALHNIPEGVAIAVPVYAATGNRWKALGVFGAL